jgi:glycosyltransferase involved in cell wall biosynthesis
MNILHIINDFTTGGSQKMLSKLISEDKNKFNNHFVIILVNKTDEIILQLKNNNISFLFFFDRNNIFSSFQVFKLLISLKPDVIQTWLYISDFVGIFFKLFSPNSRLVWNIRNGMPVKQNISLHSYIAAKLCVYFSSYCEKIICPSFESIKGHIQFGYPANKFVYIPNFIDSKYLISFSGAELSKQKKDTTVNFGFLSRYDEQKGVDVLIKAIDCLPPNLNIKFSFIGTGLYKENIQKLLKNLGIEKLNYDINFKSKTNDIQFFFQEINFHISTSRSEAFPNAVFESMFFGKPNIATKAGDSEYIISNLGCLVEINNHIMLAKSIEYFTNFYNKEFESYISLALKCNAKIMNDFNLQNVLNKYNNVWLNN